MRLLPYDVVHIRLRPVFVCRDFVDGEGAGVEGGVGGAAAVEFEDEGGFVDEGDLGGEGGGRGGGAVVHHGVR